MFSRLIKISNLLVFAVSLIAPVYIRSFGGKSVQKPVVFEVRQISGYVFQSIELGQQQQKSLGTSNILNGNFFDTKSNRVSVFKASWNSQEGSGEELYHTPDVCWVLQGFKPISVGEDSCVDLDIHGKKVQFQCRVLHHPDQSLPEIVLWAASLNGCWDALEYCRAPLPLSRHEGFFNYLRICFRDLSLKWNYIWSRIGNPSTIGVEKQIVRVSKPLSSDWKNAVSDLQEFTRKWLDIAGNESLGGNATKF
jgi:hypothetical protein